MPELGTPQTSEGLLMVWSGRVRSFHLQNGRCVSVGVAPRTREQGESRDDRRSAITRTFFVFFRFTLRSLV